MTYTLGIDVSFYQDRDDTPQLPDFKAARTQGARFAFLRAGQGDMPDPDFSNNWANAKAAGLLRGAYLFYDYRYRLQVQLDLLNALRGDDLGELPPVFDLERVPVFENGVRKYVPLPACQTLFGVMESFIDAVYEKEHRYPILYTNLEFLWYIIPLPPEKILRCPLWVACYSANPPVKLGGWEAWKFWQYTSHGDGRKYGMESGNVDLDYFNGDEAALQQFANQALPPQRWDWAITRFLREMGYAGPDPEGR